MSVINDIANASPEMLVIMDVRFVEECPEGPAIEVLPPDETAKWKGYYASLLSEIEDAIVKAMGEPFFDIRLRSLYRRRDEVVAQAYTPERPICIRALTALLPRRRAAT